MRVFLSTLVYCNYDISQPKYQNIKPENLISGFK
jgi:hypothetical protein